MRHPNHKSRKCVIRGQYIPPLRVPNPSRELPHPRCGLSPRRGPERAAGEVTVPSVLRAGSRPSAVGAAAVTTGHCLVTERAVLVPSARPRWNTLRPERDADRGSASPVVPQDLGCLAPPRPAAAGNRGPRAVPGVAPLAGTAAGPVAPGLPRGGPAVSPQGLGAPPQSPRRLSVRATWPSVAGRAWDTISPQSLAAAEGLCPSHRSCEAAPLSKATRRPVVAVGFAPRPSERAGRRLLLQREPE